MGVSELQVFVSLVVILGAAFVALICDFLKGNNEHLRESNIVLRVRENERETRAALLEQIRRQTLDAIEQGRRMALESVREQAASATAEVEAQDEAQLVFQWSAQDRRERERRSIARRDAAPAAWAQEMILMRSPQPAHEELKARHSAEAVAVMEPAPMLRPCIVMNPAHPHLTFPPQRVIPSSGLQAEAEFEEPQVEVQEPAPSGSPWAEDQDDVVRIRILQDDDVLPSDPATARANVVEMPAQSAQGELELPGGSHEPAVLEELMEDQRPFHGLAVAVSLVDYLRLLEEEGKTAMDHLMRSISELASSLTREEDLVCRVSEDEFILIFPKEYGSAATRRIQLISEGLWDFQLRSLGSMSIIFSWGALQCTGQTLAHAVEGAREQMLETRRNRRAATAGAGRFRRWVVNS